MSAGKMIAVTALGAAAALSGCGGSGMSVSPGASELYYEGRLDRSDPSSALFELPGTAVTLRFTGRRASVRLGEHSLESDKYGNVAHNWYDVTVDGKPATPFEAAEGVHDYVLASGLAAGEHQVVLRKRTEAYVGEGRFEGFDIDPDGKLLPAAPPARRLEFIGDSITAALGVDGSDAKCLFSAPTENYSHGYAALTAQTLGAAQVAVALSGAGISRNYLGSTTNTMGDLYLRAIPTRSGDRWDFSRFTPDAVVINLGTSDFTSGDPGRALFTTAYKSLIAKVRANYPSALIVVALGPMLSNLYPTGANALTLARSYVTGVVGDLNAAGDARVKLIEFPNQDNASSFGCEAHPSAATHRQMADQLAQFLRAQLAWQ